MAHRVSDNGIRLISRQTKRIQIEREREREAQRVRGAVTIVMYSECTKEGMQITAGWTDDWTELDDYWWSWRIDR